MGREFAGYKGGLRPSFRFLSDKAVIIQAWKKAHEYMRRHNWYSDNFELDCSCIDLEELLLDIQACFRKPESIMYVPSPMRVVPAPKACSGWSFEDDSVKMPENFSIRPLAHLTVRDQVVAMMFLMCLANTIEKRQKPPRCYKAAEVDDIAVNYGNRLLCESEHYATFLWGNSETYDRYYNDYRMFISRPEEVHKTLIETGVDQYYDLYMLSLDLSKFYDRIKRDVLFEKVKKEISIENKDVDDFLLAFRKLLMWRWNDDDKALLDDCWGSQLDISDGTRLEGSLGIPQGLAAGGFLANIYLLEFDDCMRRLVSTRASIAAGDLKVELFDYCRYVDDMRFVIGIRKSAMTSDVDKIQLANELQKWVDKTAPGQVFSKDKIFLDRFGNDEHTDFVALRMYESKSRISDALDEQSAQELLKINQDLWHEARGMQSTDKAQDLHIGSIRLTRNRTGVKRDTIERFSANNWRNAYKVLSSILPPDGGAASIDEIKKECPLSVLNALTDEFCEEIILRWMDDPSKVRILRISFDLRPNAIYLEEVLKMLLRMISLGGDARKCGNYVASELYRAGAIETGFEYSTEDSVFHEKWIEYRRKLHEYVARFATNEAPWYLANQLAFYEFMYSPCSFPIRCSLPLQCDGIYKECYSIISDTQYEIHGMPSLEAIILACNISEPLKVCESCKEVIKNTKRHSAIEWRKCLAFLDMEVLERIMGDSCHSTKDCFDADLEPDREYTLRDLAFKSVNPFENEVAIARLGLALCKFFETRKIDADNYFTLSDICIKCSNWDRLPDARDSSVAINVEESSCICRNDVSRYLFQPEPWESKSFAKLAQVGRLLRAVVMSGDEYSVMKRGALSVRRVRPTSEGKRFFGTRTSWLKRRYGLYFDRSCLGGVHVAFSPWFTDILSSMLAWPGSYCSKRYERLRFTGLGKVFESRLEELAKYQFVGPNTVLIPVDVDVEKFKKCDIVRQKKINIAIIQNLHPDLETLADAGIRDSRESRRISRRHLSDLITMLRVTFRTHAALMKTRDSINLLVFPELSIYERDIGYLKRFADKMNCMIFAGLVYCKDPRDDSKLINAGLWIIPQRKEGDDRRVYLELLQGKGNLSHHEFDVSGLSGYRPVQWIIRGVRYGRRGNNVKKLWSMSASICYDATDIKLAAALRDHVDCYVVSAFNKDVGLFDIMAESWRYHMYGHMVVANTGVFGGSSIQAPYNKPYERIIAHAHGGNQAQILLAELDLNDFSNESRLGRKKNHTAKQGDAGVREVKASPAGYQGRVR